jgi:hypothetical protein
MAYGAMFATKTQLQGVNLRLACYLVGSWYACNSVLSRTSVVVVRNP